MPLNLRMPERAELKPRITVFGIGGAGGNAVNNMIDKQLEGVDFVVANTDAQALAQSKCTSRIQLGEKITEGLGAGARRDVGAAAAQESLDTILDHLGGSHMCFITAGMGGGTGTGASPIVAQAARELGILTVGVVTKPLLCERTRRMRQAEEGVEEMQKVVDTLIIIPNQNLFRIANEQTTLAQAFMLADDVLYQGVKGVTDLMVRPGIINLDFADIRSVMDEMGKAMMGTGEASGDNRAKQAAEQAIANPLLDEISLHGAKGVLINITGSSDLTLFEVDEAANCISEQVDPNANIIVGSALDPGLENVMRVSVVATGIDAAEGTGEIPVPRRSLGRPLEPQKSPPPAVEAAPPPAREEMSLFENLMAEPEGPGETGDGLPAPAYRPPVTEVESVEAAADPVEEISLPPQGSGACGQPAGPAGSMQTGTQNRPPAGFPKTGAQPEHSRGFLMTRLMGLLPSQQKSAPVPPAEPIAPQAKPPVPPAKPIMPPAKPAAPPVSRPAPTAGAQEDIGTHARDDIEIPAFMRRQAN
ncbi:MAG: cell division protein FtsZ [Rhodobacteraceae bacterium]|nr:cell division protein FtsZ [Paracoccaceae bacterium]